MRCTSCMLQHPPARLAPMIAHQQQPGDLLLVANRPPHTRNSHHVPATSLLPMQVVKAGFDANYGLFTSNPDGLAYPQPKAGALPEGLPLLAMLGLVFGKALYEGILLDVTLAPFFVARLQGRRPLFDDLAGLDAELHRNLLHLKR